jgi:hypothetical protein
MLDHLNQIDNGVKQGTISGGGNLQLPLQGEAILFDIDIHTDNSNQYMSFFLTVPGSQDFRRFQLRTPSQNDKHAAQYLGMQRIYATLFGAIKADPKADLVTAVWERLTETLKTNSIKVQYEAAENSFISKRDGKEIKTLELNRLTGTARVQRVELNIQKPSAKVTSTPSAEGWGKNDSFGADVPF